MSSVAAIFNSSEDLTLEVASFLKNLTKNVQKFDLRAFNSPFADFISGNQSPQKNLTELQSAC